MIRVLSKINEWEKVKQSSLWTEPVKKVHDLGNCLSATNRGCWG